ncbi:MAG: hypothetical protein RBR47_01190 [Bacteroidales bacterium]|jgi:hypothetical protein|nr:hypothetical protein [Bacteroidales bacterium]NCU34934.1 hypothetical protein [Candidatus Falkowbacteria bacterium]MDD2633484.1 hypothetical protein [Bacteroidales bacterium]MDD3130372.1 hypothetical protein [Bacteroidales bacterium]MDD4176078.1 hypothetical protein [Bacteroidales bacterium]
MTHLKTHFCFLSVTIGLSLFVCPSYAQESSGGVFVVGGIHQRHENAKHYSYEKMGEIFQQLNPDILCVETQQKYVDDSSYTGTPYDFLKFMIPLAQKEKRPIYGIDWWDNEKGDEWQKLQQKAYNDTAIAPEINLFGGMFVILDAYFETKDFEQINSRYITNLWKAKNEFKYHVFSQSPEYRFIVEFENQRNHHIVENIRKVVLNNPGKKVLVAIGIDHKYYIEEKLQNLGIKVYHIENIEQFKK